MSASVQVVLDTEPPVLAVVAQSEASTPEDWPVLVDSSEDVGMVSAALVDAGGTISHLGVEHLGPRNFRILVPTAEVPGGSGTLLLRATDTVLNAAQVSVPIDVIRPQGYDVSLSLTPAFVVRLTIEPAYRVEMDIHRAYDAWVLLKGAYDVTLDTSPAYDVTLSISAT